MRALAAALASTFFGVTPGVYTGHGVRLQVSPDGTQIATYSFQVPATCGGLRTTTWTVDNSGWPPIPIAPGGTFSFHATTGGANAMWFQVTGAFVRTSVTGWVTLAVHARNGSYCTALASSFAATSR